MRIGVFGGTFDPVHLAHLILAEQCREQARLDQVWFMPAARPPHKHEGELTPFAQRVEMLRLALAGQPAFRVEQGHAMLFRLRPGRQDGGDPVLFGTRRARHFDASETGLREFVSPVAPRDP